METLFAKRELSAEQLMLVSSEMDNRRKSRGVMYVLWWFAGALAGHRFYMGDIGYAIAMLLLGWATLFIWPLIDVFFIGKRLEHINKQTEMDIIRSVQAQTAPAPAATIATN